MKISAIVLFIGLLATSLAQGHEHEVFIDPDSISFLGKCGDVPDAQVRGQNIDFLIQLIADDVSGRFDLSSCQISFDLWVPSGRRLAISTVQAAGLAEDNRTGTPVQASASIRLSESGRIGIAGDLFQYDQRGPSLQDVIVTANFRQWKSSCGGRFLPMKAVMTARARNANISITEGGAQSYAIRIPWILTGC
jgi:hypothetical protein